MFKGGIMENGNIVFADPNVKALCVANWDTDGDKELSYAEAAAVTDVVMEKVSSAIPKVVHFHADRPFLYAITEVSTGAIVFIGQYTGK